MSETDHFLARESELTQIRDILAGDGSRRIAVLHGLGGIGKTQLTLAYSRRRGEGVAKSPKNTRWLLVYDNYDNAKVPGNNDAAAIDIRKFFPESYQGSIIITTRLAQVKVGRQVPVKKLTKIEDSLQILANASGSQMTLNGKGLHS